jgi:hypothetical protein
MALAIDIKYSDRDVTTALRSKKRVPANGSICKGLDNES